MDSKIKPKADVRGVELTGNEKEIIENAISDIIGVDETLLKRLCEDFETIVTARLTALQSAHDEEVKELKRKVLKTCDELIENTSKDCGYEDSNMIYMRGRIAVAIENIVEEGK
jgi:hypothetical protein